MLSSRRPNLEDTKEFLATAQQFSITAKETELNVLIYNHVHEQFLGGQHQGHRPNLASKVLSLRKSDGEEKQKAIIKFQDSWKTFISKLDFYLNSYNYDIDTIKQDKQQFAKIKSDRFKLADNLHEQILELKNQASSIISAAQRRNLSGISGTLKWVGSIYLTPQCQTEKDCREILNDLDLLFSAILQYSEAEKAAINNYSNTTIKL